MNRFTRAVAMASARHPWRTVTSWVLVLVAVGFLAVSGGGTFTDDFSAKGSQSDRARHAARRELPRGGQGHGARRLRPRTGTTLDAHRPTSTDGPGRRGRARRTSRPSPTRSPPGPSPRTAGSGTPSSPSTSPSARWASRRSPCSPTPSPAMGEPGVRVELGGDAVFLNAEDKSSGHTGIGLLVALVVLLVVFGTVVAAVLPIGLSLVAVGAGIGAITLLAGAMDVSASAIPVAGLVGLGRRRRLRALRGRPLPREPRRRSGQRRRPGRRPWAPPARRSCSPAAPS